MQLFVAGIVPGLLGGFGMMAHVPTISRVKLRLAGRGPLQARPRSGRPSRTRPGRSLLPIIILGGIFGGIVTATEGAALAVVAALFVGGVIYRDLDLAQLCRAAIVDGARADRAS